MGESTCRAGFNYVIVIDYAKNDVIVIESGSPYLAIIIIEFIFVVIEFNYCQLLSITTLICISIFLMLRLHFALACHNTCANQCFNL